MVIANKNLSRTVFDCICRQLKLSGEAPQNDKTASLLAASIDTKLPVCLQFFEHEDDDVSAQCIDLLRDYLDMLKKMQP